MTEETTEKIDLAEVMRGHFEQLDEEREANAYSLLDEKGRATIETEADASLVVKTFADLNSERERVEQQYKARLARIAGKERSLDYLFGSALEAWTAANITKKKRSIILPDGTVGFRKKNAGVTTCDPAALRKWADKELPAAINWDKAPILMTIVTEHEKEHGLAPGRVEVPEDDVFSIKYPKKDTRKEFSEEKSDGE